jgi:endonuclease-3 related protein
MHRKKAGAEKLRRMFQMLHRAMGPQNWWPAGSAFEVVVGAYLTQNTAWTNVEQAMGNLRAAGVLSISGIRGTALGELERLVRPAGYFRQKAARLKGFVEHLDANYGGSLEALFTLPLAALREELLGLPGIGPETADSILLYAANREVFVVDTYTRRILERHGLVQAEAGYEEIRDAVETAFRDLGMTDAATDPSLSGMPPSLRIHPPSLVSATQRSDGAQRYNEFHALLVQTAKHYCAKAAPRCETCPLRTLLPTGPPHLQAPLSGAPKRSSFRLQGRIAKLTQPE